MDIENKTPQESEVKETKTYTAEEVNKMIEEGRKQALEEANKKAEERFQNKMKESERLAKMNEEEKLRYQLEQREKAIEEKEKALALAENKNEAGKILAEKGLSLALVDFVVAEDAETMNQNISLLEKEFNKSVKAEVEKRLSSKAPKQNLPPDQAITKDVFKNMSLAQLSELSKNNPDLYKSLTSMN